MMLFDSEKMQKDFDEWNEVKKNTNEELPRLYNVREIWWCRFGLNIGSEQDGRGKYSLRPGLIIRSFGKDTCLILPLTTSVRSHPLRIPIGLVQGKEARANVSQMRVIDTRRLVEKVGFLSKSNFQNVMEAVRNIF